MRFKIYLLASIFSCCASLLAEQPTATDEIAVHWSAPISVAQSANDDTRAVARELKELLQINSALIESDRLPDKCFRIEVWPNNATEAKGFLLQIEKENARLSASSTAELKEALEFLKSRIGHDGAVVTVPRGFFTSYDIESIHRDSTPHADQVTKQALLPRDDIPGLTNFAKISDTLYRGAQPTAEGFAQLKKMGIKTVVNLREIHSDRDKLAGTGLQYFHIHCQAWHPEDEDVVKFLKIVGDPANQPVFVHCQHGADRTGMMVAAYRIVDEGWKPDDAAQELPRFGFHTIFKQILMYLKAFQADTMKQKVADSKKPPVEVIK